MKYKMLVLHMFLLLGKDVILQSMDNNNFNQQISGFNVESVTTISNIFDLKRNTDSIRSVILDICHNITKFYRWAFLPSALVIHDNNLLFYFYHFITQVRTIIYLETQHPIILDGLFKNNDHQWHLEVDLSENALLDFIGSHSRAAIIHETLIRLGVLTSYLQLISKKASNTALKAAVTSAHRYGTVIVAALNQLYATASSQGCNSSTDQ